MLDMTVDGMEALPDRSTSRSRLGGLFVDSALVLLRALPVLEKLSKGSMAKLAAAMKTVHYDPNDSIVRGNTEGERLYIIWKGEVRVITPPRAGAIDIGHTVSTLGQGDLLWFRLEDNLQIRAHQVADLRLSSQKLLAPPDGLDQYTLKYTEANPWPAQGVSSKAMQANAADTCEKKEENLSLVPVRDHKKWPIRTSKPVSKAIQKVTKGRTSTLRNSRGRFETPKYEVVTVPAVDEVFSGPEWESFNHRQKVKAILSQFSFLVSYYRSQSIRRPHLAAGKYLRAKRFCFNEGKSVVGNIPGVRVGDKFKFREELLLLIVTRTTQAGIEYIPASESDYVGEDGRRVSVAVGVVCSEGYKDNEEDGESLVYVGSGGHKNLVKSSGATDQKEKDQKLVRGNLALKNSCELGVPVRVIRGEMFYEDKEE
ncbi:hypothetical protein R1sor_012349 [Riccia sorocarpa]|uniref:Cyclic nucleotide-binding domain-containing protein n=1 Tax=Riccia sorocarpa TaxID=122646 RepID=A0ABD3I3V6_9MARC